MSEIVERVAKAIWALNQETDCNEYDQLAPHARAMADSWARAAIAAMREPTQAQYDALCATDKLWKDQTSETVWKTYIDAALK